MNFISESDYSNTKECKKKLFLQFLVISEITLNYVVLILNLLSVISNIILLFIIKKHSLFSKIYRNSIRAEGFLHFCIGVLFLKKLYGEQLKTMFIDLASLNVFLVFIQKDKIENSIINKYCFYI